MWNKKLVITKHAKQRFKQRNLHFFKTKDTIKEMLADLDALNVMKIEHIQGNHHKVTTRQGKIYIVVETEDTYFVKTVYKTNVQYELALKHLSEEEKTKCKLSIQNH